MRNLYLLLVLIASSHLTFSQVIDSQIEYDQLFVQCKIHLDEVNQTELQNNLDSNPYVFLVRYDALTNGLFVVTKNIQLIDQSIFESWLSEYGNLITCFRKGVQGVDVFIPFDENYCSTVTNE